MDTYPNDEDVTLAFTGGSVGLKGVNVVTQSFHAQKFQNFQKFQKKRPFVKNRPYKDFSLRSAKMNN